MKFVKIAQTMQDKLDPKEIKDAKKVFKKAIEYSLKLRDICIRHRYDLQPQLFNDVHNGLSSMIDRVEDMENYL